MLAATVMALGGAVLAAPPASAVVNDCQPSIAGGFGSDFALFLFDLDLAAGDTLVVNETGTSAIRLEVPDGTLQDSGSGPDTLRYVVPSDGTYDVTVSSSGGTASFTVGCDPATGTSADINDCQPSIAGGFGSDFALFLFDLDLAAGDTLVVNETGTSAIRLEVPDGTLQDSGSGPDTLRYVVPSDGTYDVTVSSSGGTASFTVGCDPATGTSAANGAGSPIPDWVQSYGRFGKDAPCEDSWNPSWEEWAQPFTGGWVCTRSLPSLG